MSWPPGVNFFFLSLKNYRLVSWNTWMTFLASWWSNRYTIRQKRPGMQRSQFWCGSAVLGQHSTSGTQVTLTPSSRQQPTSLRDCQIFPTTLLWPEAKSMIACTLFYRSKRWRWVVFIWMITQKHLKDTLSSSSLTDWEKHKSLVYLVTGFRVNF